MVAKGYKQTEIGVIPEDWNVVQVKNICKLINGRGFKPHEWQKEGLPIIRIQNLNGSEKYNYFNGSYNKKLEVEAGQLLFAWSGSRGTSFGPHIWHGEKGLLNYHTWKVIVDRNSISDNYFFYILKKLTKFIEENAHGASALVHTQKGEMENFFLPIPPKQEQKAIADALSDVDVLIASLESLIEKKEAIKTATMQQLLTGKKRLPGFSGEWVERKLGELGTFSKGKGIKKDEALSGHIPCVRYGEIYTLHNEYIKNFFSFISEEVKKESTRLKKGDLLFAGSGETKEEIGKCVAFLGNFEAYAGGDIVILSPKKVDSLFMGYLLNIPYVSTQKSSKGQGDAVVHISADSLSEIEVKLPPNLEEQQAIAQILSDMDEEIEALKTKLEKTKAIKQGMMQELLTGRVRLV